MQTTLLNFTNQDLFDASRAFFAKIGVKCTDQSRLPLNFLSVYEKSVKKLGLAVPQALADVFAKIETTHVIGAVTEDSLHGNTSETSLEQIEAAEQHYKGMLLMAVKVKDGIALTRTEMTQVTRGANRIATHNPVTVLILQAGKLSIATCERTQFVQSWRPGEKLGKVSVLKDIDCSKPHRGHLDILDSMSVKACKTYDELYAKWRKVFSSSILTENFYREIQNWYFWALKPEQNVRFPNALHDSSDDDKFNNENVIRLITRLIFTWFLKEKGLVNEKLFDVDYVKTILKDFDPEAGLVDPDADRFPLSCNYYTAILQNLFFATFNQEIKNRVFVSAKYRDVQKCKVKNYYRNAKLFVEQDERKILSYFSDSPAVNGGLFECLDDIQQLDKTDGKVKTYRWDGFSENYHDQTGDLKRALLSNKLFFCSGDTCDLTQELDSKTARAVKVRGLIRILESYYFTIEESTPLDEEVALDPELLGKVFENLLGCYNPETQKMARNSTGSFYTPREIVTYMVRESIAAYLLRMVPEVPKEEIRLLVEGREDLDRMPSVQANAEKILQALFRMKILDPACGSGAFPMGIMSVMVAILAKVDPTNKYWHKIVLHESLEEAKQIGKIEDEEERAKMQAEIEAAFDSRSRNPDYARKLYVIQHCVFGGDIQPIAVQISRLRFFITLLCEQTKTDDKDDNYGITPLPNLENNFVSANSLLAIDIGDMREIFCPREIRDGRTREGKADKAFEARKQEILDKVERLRETRRQLFLPKRADQKARLEERDADLRQKIEDLAVALYDTQMLEQLKMYEGELAKRKAELAALPEQDRHDRVEMQTETDLFGNTETREVTIKSPAKKIESAITDLEFKVADIKSETRKRQLLNDVRRLVKWNPFSFNVSEDFLDPEWMFGVKDGFDIIIANPPYIKEYENRKAFDGFREQSPYYIGKMDLWYGFACKGIDALKEGGILCFIAQNNWTTSAGASKMREKVLNDVQILQLMDFNDYIIFESAGIQTMVMLFRKGADNESYDLLRYVLPDGAQYEDLRKALDDHSVMKAYHLEKEAYKDRSLTFSDNEGLLAKIAQGKLMLTDKEATNGIHTHFDVVDRKINQRFPDLPIGLGIFCLSDKELGDMSLPENEKALIKPFFTSEQVSVYYTSRENTSWIIYTGSEFKDTSRMLRFPKIKAHLDVVSKAITSDNKPYGLHRARQERFFAGEKIAALRKCVGRPVFSYSDFPCYLPASFYVIQTERWNMRFLTGLLNSQLIAFWLKNKGKMQGTNYQLDKEPLLRIPLVQPNDDAQNEVAQKVDAIIAAKKDDPQSDTTALEAEIDGIVYKLYGLTDDEIAVVEKAVKK